MRHGPGHGRCGPEGHRRRFGRDGLHGPREGGRGRGRLGALGRFFAHGDLRLAILHLIAEKPRHGYEIIKDIEQRVGGAYSPSPGVIYPTLTLLEELGQVTVTAEGGRKLHAITDQGRAFLAANRPGLDALLERMEEAGRAGDEGPPPQVVRAMENVKLAVRLRLARGPLTTEQADAIAAALDAAATSVERIG
ncbi:MAG TPA: PadR family transcriptional regulator [Geminicoccus sp.]|uniref:PadR family transcriptional regulator n=1 Tax=Geminicoccus sp. TaxID=2024832 RepID=UPI002CCC003E|nr:PadR family transcriptional regulator [Geminicoccus sp.]HWL71071.1 PadR family transcriptional regulator [Geminicoccus sp.]